VFRHRSAEICNLKSQIRNPMRPIIRVENLSKQYRIGAAQAPYKTLRESLTDAVRAPFSRLWSNGNGADNTVWALKDVSFEVMPGEIVGIIGRNGAGKSTLLKILSRITEPTRGKVDLYGRVGSLLEVGTGFHSELTGRENIFLNGAILGMKRDEIEEKFDEIVAFAETEKFLDTPVKHYSSGMYMRLAFAVAAHLEPEILVVDEVLAVGDAEFQKKCLNKMSDVARQGRTVLFVSHNMNAIERLCLSVLMLEKGEVRERSRSIDKVIKSYFFDSIESEAGEWINPGDLFENPWFKPLRFVVSDGNGRKKHQPVSNDSESWIEIEAKIEQLDQALTVGYAIYSEEGSLLYWSYQTDGPSDHWPELRRGHCVLRSRLPGRLLNEGVYKIELIGGLHFRQWLFEPIVNCPVIYLNIQGGLSDSPVWMNKRPGLLAPVIRWIGDYESC
jgi:lipopolysaccharide transport system ATP-binding protein